MKQKTAKLQRKNSPDSTSTPLEMIDLGRFFSSILAMGKTLEITGKCAIWLPHNVLRLGSALLFATADAFFFLVYLLTKVCEYIGRVLVHLPFRLVQLAVEAMHIASIIMRHAPVVLHRLFSPVFSLMLGVPVVDASDFKESDRKNRFAWPTFKVSVSGFTQGPKKLALSYIEQVDVYRAFRRQHTVGFAFSTATLLSLPAISLLLYITIMRELPLPSKLRTYRPAQTTRIFDRNGILLYKIYRSANRTPLKLSEIPQSLQEATIAIEDRGFYSHHGISLRGIARAAVVNFSGKEFQFNQGGSTITQQLVKNTLLTPEKTVERKLKEIVLSLVAEVIYTKKEILEMYLNTVPYGGTAYGVEEASWTYFKKSVRDLNLAEAALLAGLPSAPTAFSPHGTHPELARIRQKEVLRNMVEMGYMTKAQMEQTLSTEVAIAPPTVAINAPHFVMYVKDYLTERYGLKMVEEGGMQVITTLDLSTQKKAEEVVAEQNKELRIKYRANNAAAMVTSPRTGEILAMVGSANFWDKDIHGEVNVTTSLRQPGSSIKVVNYAYALSHGFTPSTVLYDTPVVYKIAGSIPYAPVNYDGKFHGAVTLRQALARSYNIPAVKVLATYGPKKMIEMGQRMGISTWDRLQGYGLSLTLGAGEVKMVDMAVVYGTLANNGIRKDLTPIRHITDAYGNSVKAKTEPNFSSVALAKENNDDSGIINSHDGEAVLSPSVAYWLTDILSDNKARLVAFGPYAKLEIPGHKVAVKTGTTNEFRDNWTVGYTPDYLVASWVGNTNNTPMNKNLVSGITGAAPIWNGIMTSLLQDKPNKEFDKPEGLIPVKICASTGTLTCQFCKDTVTEYFMPGTEPKRSCTIASPDDCAKKKAQAEADGKKPEEIASILGGCSLPTSTPNP